MAASDRRQATNIPPPRPKRIGKPDRVKEVVQAGKTYTIIVKGVFDARVEDKDWGLKQVTNLGFMFEASVERTIESNDGNKIVELRHFKSVRMVKTLCEVEGVTIELGPPGVLVLATLEYFVPGAGTTLVGVKPLVEAVMTKGANAIAEENLIKVFPQVDSLSGKKVRITYVDGLGVESLEPVACRLTPSESDFVFNTAVLSDYYIMPEVKIKVGGTWSVDGRQFAGFLDPSMRGVPQGELVIVRDADHEKGGKQYSTLHIQSGHLEIDSSDASTRRLGSYTPRGTLFYNITDGFVETASMTGKALIEEVSEDHLLFEAHFRTQPVLKVNYSCRIR